uniref:chromate efflux transporter n=1 Tax=Stappia sp. TaxID=1870903 RepID=UPI003BA86910
MTYPASETTASETPTPAQLTLSALALRALRIGLLSFGGPAAQIALLHREFVTEARAISEERFLGALNFCMILPGPEAQQLATYCGWLTGGLRGGLVSGLLFILPGAALMLALSIVYVTFGDTGLVTGLFYGVKAGVLAIVVQALMRLAARALRTTLSRMIALLAFAALAFAQIPFPLVILAAGVAGAVFSRTTPTTPACDDAATSGLPARTGLGLRGIAGGLALWAAPVALAAVLLTPETVLVDIAAFFSTMALVSFGGAYALLNYMAQVAVEAKGWLDAGEMLDGLGLAETTPGPLILVTQFVGFIAGYREVFAHASITGGVLAAMLTTWTTFAPSFLFVLAGAPHVERVQRIGWMAGALAAIAAAVVGTILDLAVWFSANVLFRGLGEATLGPFTVMVPRPESLDASALALAVLAALLLFGAKRGVATVVAVSAFAGLGLELAGLATP